MRARLGGLTAVLLLLATFPASSAAAPATRRCKDDKRARCPSPRAATNSPPPGPCSTRRPSRRFRQEFFKGQAEDHFKILERHASVTVPAVSSGSAMKTEEWTPLEPGVIDNKFYVRGIGTVKEAAVKGADEHLELVSVQEGP